MALEVSSLRVSIEFLKHCWPRPDHPRPGWNPDRRGGWRFQSQHQAPVRNAGWFEPFFVWRYFRSRARLELKWQGPPWLVKGHKWQIGEAFCGHRNRSFWKYHHKSTSEPFANWNQKERFICHLWIKQCFGSVGYFEWMNALVINKKEEKIVSQTSKNSGLYSIQGAQKVASTEHLSLQSYDSI